MKTNKIAFITFHVRICNGREAIYILFIGQSPHKASFTVKIHRQIADMRIAEEKTEHYVTVTFASIISLFNLFELQEFFYLFLPLHRQMLFKAA